MGDRVLIATKDRNGHSPFIYLHWKGAEAPELIKAAQPKMRKGDAAYAAFALAASIGESFNGRTKISAGLLPYDDNATPESQSHGDAGVYIVDVDTGHVYAEGGYGEDFDLPPDGFSNW